ncbi:MAG TPA: GNAT family N-acetyltransferase [Pyrinomonadaceae bacterium]|jgi:GNAT superfamily N-acetyltransferase|nr:GNAT family N-acetyltransferase [Pyrinomonadaceae bacterium]
MLDRRQYWPHLEAENQAELLAHLGTASCAASHHSAAITWVMTGVDSNDYNGVLHARLTPAQADRQVPALVEMFRERRVPALWHLDPESCPADLAERLARLGCPKLSPGVCMAAPLGDLAGDDFTVPPGLTVGRVRTLADLADWIDVWIDGDDEARGAREQLYACLGVDGPRPLRHYLARLNNQPVGVSQLFLGRRSAGLYCVAVPPAFRRRGIGRALTLRPLRDARDLGYSVAVLGPSPEGQPLYRSLGFECFASPFVGYSLWHDA